MDRSCYPGTSAGIIDWQLFQYYINITSLYLGCRPDWLFPQRRGENLPANEQDKAISHQQAGDSDGNNRSQQNKYHQFSQSCWALRCSGQIFIWGENLLEIFWNYPTGTLLTFISPLPSLPSNDPRSQHKTEINASHDIYGELSALIFLSPGWGPSGSEMYQPSHPLSLRPGCAGL